LVNNGDYNLEVILQYGYSEFNAFELEIFVPEFTIDLVITPEIFKPYGVTNGSTLFPDNLDFPEDDFCESCES